MLLFITVLVAILLTYVVVCSAVFIYRHQQCIVPLCHHIAIITFFLLTACFFGIKALVITIVVYWTLTGLLKFVLRKLSKSVIDYSLLDKNNFSLNYKSYSNSVGHISIENGKQNHPIKLSRLFLCAFVPLWLIGLLTVKTFSGAFSCGSYMCLLTCAVKNKLSAVFRNRKTA